MLEEQTHIFKKMQKMKWVAFALKLSTLLHQSSKEHELNFGMEYTLEFLK